MAGIGIILNPHSSAHKKDPDKIRRMAFVVGEKAEYNPTGDLFDLRRVAEQFKSRDIDILAIAGGDGTTHVTLTHFIDVYGEKKLPQITFLRGGTMNSLANACKIKGAPEKILSNLIYKYHEGKPFQETEMDIMQVNDKYGFIFGCGVIYRFMADYYSGVPPSPPKATYTLTRTITSALLNSKYTQKMFRRFDADVWVDGKKWPFANWAAVYAGSIPIFGLKFRVFHYSQEYQKFHAIGFSLPPRNILRYVPNMYFGKKFPCEEMMESPAKEMRIELDEPIPYTIDGDMLPPERTITVKIGPRLKILVK